MTVNNNEMDLRSVVNRQKKGVALAVAIVTLLALHGAHAAGPAYPTRPVRFLVPAPPGGTVDHIARLLAPPLSEQLGKPFVVDNRSGAGGVIAAEMIANAAPDGHTIAMIYTAYTTNAVMRAQATYSPLTGNTPITQATWSPLLLALHAGLPVKSVSELVAMAKAKPMLYGSAGNGSGGHMAAELFNTMTGIRVTHVPYKGAAAATNEVVSGQVAYQFAGPITVLALGRAGRLRLLAVTSLKRANALPDLPTVDESGVPGLEVINWFGVVAPPATPHYLIERLHGEIKRALAPADIRARLASEGSEIAATTPDQFRAFIRNDVEKWTRVVAAAKIKAE
jgi:tripartite-type tricarboxylate transporter receptor subunit TctC